MNILFDDTLGPGIGKGLVESVNARVTNGRMSTSN